MTTHSLQRYLSLVLLALVSLASLMAQDISQVIDKGTALYQDKEYTAAIDLLSTTLDKYQGEASADVIGLQMLLAKNYMHDWQSEAASRTYLAAWRMAEDIGNDSLYVDAVMSYISLLSFRQERDSILVLARQVLARPDIHYTVESNALLYLAMYYDDEQKNDSAIYYATLATQIDSIYQDSSSIPFAYYDLANYYQNAYNYEKAISKMLFGITYLRPGIDDYKRSSMELGLASVYYKIGNLINAEELALQSLDYGRKHQMQRMQTSAYLLLGDCASYGGRYEEALQYYVQADSVNAAKSKNIFREVQAKAAIIHTKLDLGREVDRSELDAIVRKVDDIESPVIINMVHLLQLRMAEYLPAEFEAEYQRLYESSAASEIRHLRLAMLQIKKEYLQRKGLYKQAIEVSDEINAFKRQITSTNNEYIIQNLIAKHRKQEQDARISYLDQQNSIQQKIVDQQRHQIVGGSIALMLISFLSFFLYRLYHKVSSQRAVITKALAEKDILLREIHHRVKNNLQMVSSLLTLQGRSIDDAAALQAINEGKSRVRSMALIHQDLYNKDNLTGISVKDYLEKLTTELLAAYRVDNQTELIMDIADIELDVDTLVPLGLIINELITNSLKYAWPDGEPGSLSVNLREQGGHLRLQVVDDGVGYRQGDISSQSFGNTLISALTAQLDGSMTTSSVDGTSVEITFADYEMS